MIHIGRPEYYGHIRKNLEECDVILFEGIKTFRSRVVTLSYRLAARRRRLGLVVQGNAFLFSGIRGRLIHADVAPGEFNEKWSQIPWHVRLAPAGRPKMPHLWPGQNPSPGSGGTTDDYAVLLALASRSADSLSRQLLPTNLSRLP
jgi:hypothetical protein